MFGIKKGEYEEVVKANNELRAKMEKLRLENAVLKDQVHALMTLPPELSSLYMFIQPRSKVTMADLKSDPKIGAIGDEQLNKNLEAILATGLIEKNEKDWVVYYSARAPDMSEAWVPRGGGSPPGKSVPAQQPIMQAQQPGTQAQKPAMPAQKPVVQELPTPPERIPLHREDNEPMPD